LEFIHAELLREMGEHIGILVILHNVYGLTSIDESVTEHFALFLQDILGHHLGEGKAGRRFGLPDPSNGRGELSCSDAEHPSSGRVWLDK